MLTVFNVLRSDSMPRENGEAQKLRRIYKERLQVVSELLAALRCSTPYLFLRWTPCDTNRARCKIIYYPRNKIFYPSVLTKLCCIRHH